MWSGLFVVPSKNLYIGIGYVFVPNFSCTIMKTDMEESENIYDFLKDYFWEIESEKDWRKLSLSNLKCSRCLLCAALKLVKKEKDKYGKESVARLATAKSIVSKRYFKYKLLKWFVKYVLLGYKSTYLTQT